MKVLFINKTLNCLGEEDGIHIVFHSDLNLTLGSAVQIEDFDEIFYLIRVEAFSKKDVSITAFCRQPINLQYIDVRKFWDNEIKTL